MTRRSLPGFASFALGAAALGLCTTLLPFVGAGRFSYAAQVSAYALILIPLALVLYGFPTLVGDLATPRLLAVGAAVAVAGVLATLPGRPENLAEGPRLLPLVALFVANLLRVAAAATVGLALARYVNSSGVALLIAGVATASDLFSVFAGPTKALVQGDSPALDFLLLIFPTFGRPLGFGLGISDFIFLALFAAVARLLDLRSKLTLASGCAATVLAMTAGLLLERPLPALPFISLSFVLANADLLYRALARRDRARRPLR